MTSISKQRQWLYLLTAIVLLMQSFAFWHDAGHPFHSATEQCAPFHAVGHTPGADITSSALPLAFQQWITIEVPVQDSIIILGAIEHHPIRAPPIFS